MEDDVYKVKYLKYKNKYLELKQQRGGLVTLKSGLYLYLTNAETLKSNFKLEKNEDGPSVSELNDKLSFSYRIGKGETKLEKLKNFDDRFARGVDTSLKVASAIGSTALDVAQTFAFESVAPGASLTKTHYDTAQTDAKISNNIYTDTKFDGTSKSIKQYLDIINKKVPNKVNVGMILQVNQFGKNKIIGLHKLENGEMRELI